MKTIVVHLSVKLILTDDERGRGLNSDDFFFRYVVYFIIIFNPYFTFFYSVSEIISL